MPSYFMNERIARLKFIEDILKRSKEEYNFINYDKFVYDIQIRFGLSEQNAKSHLDSVIRGLGASVDKDGEITWQKTE